MIKVSCPQYYFRVREIGAGFRTWTFSGQRMNTVNATAIAPITVKSQDLAIMGPKPTTSPSNWDGQNNTEHFNLHGEASFTPTATGYGDYLYRQYGGLSGKRYQQQDFSNRIALFDDFKLLGHWEADWNFFVGCYSRTFDLGNMNYNGRQQHFFITAYFVGACDKRSQYGGNPNENAWTIDFFENQWARHSHIDFVIVKVDYENDRSRRRASYSMFNNWFDNAYHTVNETIGRYSNPYAFGYEYGFGNPFLDNISVQDGWKLIVSSKTIKDLFQDEFYPETSYLSDMANDAYANMKYYNGNGRQFISEIPGVFDFLTSWKDAATAATDLLLPSKKKGKQITMGDVFKHNSGNPSCQRLKNAIKSSSGAYLSTHYGIKLTLKDLSDMQEAEERYFQDQERLKYANYLTSHNQHEYTRADGTRIRESYQFKYTEKSTLSGYRESYSTFSKLARVDFFDLRPTLENAWDSVPYSFVVDWFLPIGDALTNLQNRMDAERWYKMVQPIYSKKRTKVLDASALTKLGIGLDLTPKGDIIATHYVRTIMDDLYKPSILPQPSAETGFHHWLEAGALVVQRLL